MVRHTTKNECKNSGNVAVTITRCGGEKSRAFQEGPLLGHAAGMKLESRRSSGRVCGHNRMKNGSSDSG